MSYVGYERFCGCYYIPALAIVEGWGPPSIRWLPQVKLAVHATILSTISRTVLSQTFTNPSSTDIIREARYTFPLYDGVSVVGFNCRIGERLIRGVVKERAKAKAVYDEAVAQGETAGLLERLPEAGDVFTTKIGNIPANEKVVVEITYVGELKHDAEADGIRFTIPTKIAPRYGDLPGGVVNSQSDSSGGSIQITVDVALPAKSSIRGIQSPSHPIAVAMGSTSAGVSNEEFEANKGAATLSLGEAELEKDFVLLVLAQDIMKPQALLETHPRNPHQRALMVTLVPKFALPPSKPEVVFIVDRSGSMRKNIPTLILALKVFLKSLPVGVKFNICSFGSSYSMLWQRSKSYDQITLQEAVQHVESFSANMGGTEMFHPVKAVIENRYKDMDLEVMLLTDGEIWNQQEIFSYLNKEVVESEAPIRVFSLGIGNAASHSLIEGIARAGNGFAQSVGINEKLDSKIVRMLKGGLSPHVKDYTLEVKYEDAGDEEEFEMVEKVSEGLRILGLDFSSKMITDSPLQKKPVSLFNAEVDLDQQTTPPSDPDGTQAKYSHLPEIPPPRLLQAPSRVPPLFPFSRTVVYLLMSPEASQKTPKSVILRGTSPHGPLELDIPIQLLPDKAETIHQLAAKKAVGELEEGRGWIFDAKDDVGVPIRQHFDGRWDDIVEREAVRLGVEFQVGGKWCSFVAVNADEAGAETLDSNIEIQHSSASKSSATSRQHSRGSLGSAPRSTGFRCLMAKRRVAGLPSAQFGSSLASQTPASDSALFSLPPPSSVGFGSRASGLLFEGPSSVQFCSLPASQTPASDSALFGMPPPSSVGFGSHVSGLQPQQLRATVQNSSTKRSSGTLLSDEPTRDASILHLLIALQTFEGAWELDDKLCSIIGITESYALKNLDETAMSVSSEEVRKQWATILAIAYFENKLAVDMDTWELVVDKARDWLGGAVKPEVHETLAKRAKELVLA